MLYARRGSGFIASDEENGRLDLIIAHPVGRSAFFFGRLVGMLGAASAILLLGWLGLCLLAGGSSLGINWAEMAVPFVLLLAQLLVYATLALVLSMFLPSRNLAAMVSGLVMVSSYFVSSLAFMDERMANAAKLMPYYYFQPVLSFDELNLVWVFALLGACVLMSLIAWIRFTRRDIRLAGEGSWKLPFMKKRQPAA